MSVIACRATTRAHLNPLRRSCEPCEAARVFDALPGLAGCTAFVSLNSVCLTPRSVKTRARENVAGV
ncbi:hypothetical protein E2C01_097496 [Portunus trituberculatus]|uniref:Uncharacterized protein n=1 Tax=Portunus trituberculatus TaxID=210409 RepID=A0A5B7KBJ8_PORTR|nr:hypothetical protein [Portunus trituberculatus]